MDLQITQDSSTVNYFLMIFFLKSRTVSIAQNRTQGSMTIDTSLWNGHGKDNRNKLRAGQTPERFRQKAYGRKVCVNLLLSLWRHLYVKSYFLKKRHQKGVVWPQENYCHLWRQLHIYAEKVNSRNEHWFGLNCIFFKLNVNSLLILLFAAQLLFWQKPVKLFKPQKDQNHK